MVLKHVTGTLWGDRLLWWCVFLLGALPLLYLVGRVLLTDLGPDPAKAIVQYLGRWALRFLWITLAVTPLRQITHWRWPQRFRRMLGLYALFYAVLHLIAYALLMLGGRLDLLTTELVKRPYIVVGLLSLLLIIPLGITSTRGWMRRLGKNWKRLHWLIYPSAIAALIHLIWQIRASFAEALLYGVLLCVLLGWRLWWKKRQSVRFWQKNSGA